MESNFITATTVQIVTGGTPVVASAITTAITAYKIDQSGHPDPDSGLTSTNDIVTAGTGTSWGNFVETSGTDLYNVFFFFSASSLDWASSTYEVTASAGAGVVFSNKIYQIQEGGSDTNFYALAMSFPERYETSAGSETYSVTVKIVTNDPETFLNTRLQVTHTYCKASETVQTPQE